MVSKIFLIFGDYLLEIFNMASKKWKEENVDKLKEYRRNWYERNRENEIAKAKERQKNRRKDLSKWWHDYKSQLSCEICGFSHPAVIDFHHMNPDEKDGNLANMIKNKSREKVIEEIKKCRVLCSNCHRILHYNENTD
jgi:predicted HNH restriction endonuclease